MEKYDTFKPGDMLRKAVTNPVLGVRYHYAIYVGKDESGGHRIIESNGKAGQRPQIDNNSIFLDGKLSGSEYDVVEISDPSAKRLTPDEIVDRAKQMAGTPFRFKGFADNCETFARAMAEDRAHSTQSTRTNSVTNAVVAAIFSIGGDIAGSKKPAMSSAEMLEWIRSNQAKPRDFPADRSIPDISEYDQATEVVASMAPKLSKRIRVQARKNYLLAAFAQAASQKQKVTA